MVEVLQPLQLIACQTELKGSKRSGKKNCYEQWTIKGSHSVRCVFGLTVRKLTLKFLLFKIPGMVLMRGSLLCHKWNACCWKTAKQFIRSFFRLRNNKDNTYWTIMVQVLTSLDYKLVPSNMTGYGNSPFVKCDVEYSSHKRYLNLSYLLLYSFFPWKNINLPFLNK